MKEKFITKDSGKRQKFSTGAKRDTQKGKIRYDLIPFTAMKRVAGIYTRGAEKYDDWNWSKGMPFSRFVASAMRHFYQYLEGERDEDHLSACIFNLMAIIHFEEVGRKKELDDLPKFNNK